MRCRMPRRPMRERLPPPDYRFSAMDLLRTATNPAAVDAILAGASQLYQAASPATRRRWDRAAATRKRVLGA